MTSDTTTDWMKIPCTISELDLKVLLCGQSFRWTLLNAENRTYLGIANHRIWEIKQNSTHLHYKCLGRFSRAEKFESDQAALLDYFQLKSTVNLEQLHLKWSLEDGHFAKISQKSQGLRVLNLDPVECIFSFICSSNNNIKRISQMIENLCKFYGEKLEILDNKEAFYDFPSVANLANQNSEKLEKHLRNLNFGYRAKYIVETARFLAEKFGSEKMNDVENQLLELRQKDYKECHDFLSSLSGVGPKVTDCICLMSMKKHNIVPIDRHVLRLSADFYLPHLKKCKHLNLTVRKEISDFFTTKFGPYAGWAQVALFVNQLKR